MEDTSRYDNQSDWLPLTTYIEMLMEVDESKCISLPPVRPQPGDIFFYHNRKKPSDWKSDQYRWRQSGKKRLPIQNPVVNCRYCKDHGNADWYKRIYNLIDHENSDFYLIHYVGSLEDVVVRPHGNRTKHNRTKPHVRTAPSVIEEQRKSAKGAQSATYRQMVSEGSAQIKPELLAVLTPRDCKQISNTISRRAPSTPVIKKNSEGIFETLIESAANSRSKATNVSLIIEDIDGISSLTEFESKIESMKNRNLTKNFALYDHVCHVIRTSGKMTLPDGSTDTSMTECQKLVKGMERLFEDDDLLIDARNIIAHLCRQDRYDYRNCVRSLCVGNKGDYKLRAGVAARDQSPSMFDYGTANELDANSVAQTLIDERKVTLVPEQKCFVVTSLDGENKYCVELFPKRKCTCPAQKCCDHIRAAAISIGMEAPGVEPKGRKRGSRSSFVRESKKYSPRKSSLFTSTFEGQGSNIFSNVNGSDMMESCSSGNTISESEDSISEVLSVNHSDDGKVQKEIVFQSIKSVNQFPVIL